MKLAIAVRRSRAASWARLAGALAVPVLALAALGNRVGIVPPEALIPLLVVGFALALTALGLGIYALVDIWNSGAEGAGTAIAGIVYALPVLVLLGLVAAAALAYPRLTDVSTDVNDPPVLRNPGDPAAARPDPDRFAQQSEAYPELRPRLYSLPIADLYAKARALVDDRNWTVTREAPPSSPPAALPSSEPHAEADAALEPEATATPSGGASGPEGFPPSGPAAGDAAAAPATGTETAVLQAVARTLLFGFADDVALRLRETPDGTQVDMRSASRIGRHDLGQNARRIKQFFADLDTALQPDPNAPPSGVPTAEAEPSRIDPADAARAAELSAD